MNKYIIICIMCFVCFPMMQAQNIQYTKSDSVKVESFLMEAYKQDFTTNWVLYFSSKLMGIPYVAKTLEGNDTEKLIINFGQRIAPVNVLNPVIDIRDTDPPSAQSPAVSAVQKMQDLRLQILDVPVARLPVHPAKVEPEHYGVTRLYFPRPRPLAHRLRIVNLEKSEIAYLAIGRHLDIIVLPVAVPTPAIDVRRYHGVALNLFRKPLRPAERSVKPRQIIDEPLLDFTDNPVKHDRPGNDWRVNIRHITSF